MQDEDRETGFEPKYAVKVADFSRDHDSKRKTSLRLAGSMQVSVAARWGETSHGRRISEVRLMVDPGRNDETLTPEEARQLAAALIEAAEYAELHPLELPTP